MALLQAGKPTKKSPELLTLLVQWFRLECSPENLSSKLKIGVECGAASLPQDNEQLDQERQRKWWRICRSCRNYETTPYCWIGGLAFPCRSAQRPLRARPSFSSMIPLQGPCRLLRTAANEDLIKELARFEPLRVVFRDTGVKNDSVKINVSQIFKQLSPDTEVESI